MKHALYLTPKGIMAIFAGLFLCIPKSFRWINNLRRSEICTSCRCNFSGRIFEILLSKQTENVYGV